MPLQGFVDNSTPTIKAAWLNAIDNFYFTLFQSATTAAAARAAIAAANSALVVSGGGLVTGGGDLTTNRVLTVTGASQVQQEAASSTSVSVTPQVQQFHPSAVKGWCQAQTTGAIGAAYNVASVTDTGVGDANINWLTGMSTVNYTAVVGVQTDNNLISRASNTSFSAAFTRIIVFDLTGSPADPNLYHIVACGDQP